MLYSNSWQLYLLSPSILFLLLFYSSLFICFFLPEGHTSYEHGRPASVNSASLQDGFRQASQYQLRAVHSSDGDTLSHHTYITADTHTFLSVFYRQQSYCNIADFNYISKACRYIRTKIIFKCTLLQPSSFFFFFAYRPLIQIQYPSCSNSFFWRVSLHFRHQTCWIAYKSNSAYLFLNINQVDALHFITSLFQASTRFEHMCSSSGGQKLYYTVSGIITLKQVNGLKLLK